MFKIPKRKILHFSNILNQTDLKDKITSLILRILQMVYEIYEIMKYS